MKAKSTRLSLAVAVATLALGTAAQAVALRTFISSTGNDANTASNCAATAPCRTLASAFTVTSANGEIIIVDAAGYGAVTITRAVTIVGTPGALIGVPAGGTGITINAGASDIVTIRNLLITGGAAGTNTGIALNTGKLVLQQSALKALNRGLQVVNAKAYVDNTDFIGNTTAVHATGTGSPTGNFQITGTTIVKLSGGNVIENTTAYNQVSPGVGNANIVLRMTDNSAAAITVNHGGNTTLATGSGTGCPCDSVGTYQGNTTFN